MIRRDHQPARNLRRFALRRPAPRGIAQPQKAPHRNVLGDGARLCAGQNARFLRDDLSHLLEHRFHVRKAKLPLVRSL
jgi:hypothetical protein